MPDFNNLPLVLAGPIVRRVEPQLASVWVALSQARTVELGLWTGPIVATSGSGFFGNATAAHRATAETIRLGNKLHLALVVLDLSATPLIPGQLYSYNLVFSGSGGDKDLNSLSLLTEVTTADHPHLALGYLPNQLPAFAMPPPGLDALRLVHSSCRKAHGGGADGLAMLDNLIERDLANSASRPHQLFLTGDQVYADDVASALLPELTETGNALLGVTEKLLVEGASGGNLPVEPPVTTDNFPATWRQELVAQRAHFTSGEAANHVLAFSRKWEFAGGN
jgi:hypothetical protein